MQRALQKAQFMLRQATNQKAELQTQVADLQKQIEQLKGSLAETKAAANDTKRKMQKDYGSAIDEWKRHDAGLSDELAATRDRLARQTDRGNQLEAQLKTQAQNFSVCYDNNKKLYDINKQLLTRYKNKGFGDVLEQQEPFTGIKQVEIENLVQDYRYKIDDLKVPTASPVASNDGAAGGTQDN